MSLLAKIKSRVALIPHAQEGKRLSGRGYMRQMWDIFRLRYGPTKLRSTEYYDFRLWNRPFSEARDYSGDWHRKHLHRTLNNKAWEVLLTDRLAQIAQFRFHGLPTAGVYAVASREPRLPGPGPLLRGAAELAAFLRDGMTYPTFVKPVKGGEGRGCLGIEGYDAEKDELELTNGQRRGVEEMVYGLHDPTGYGLMFLEHYRTHPELRELCGSGILAVRIVLLVGDDGPELYHADACVPHGRNMTSNFYHGKYGNLLALIDPATGEFSRVFKGTNGNDLEATEIHPHSNRRIAGYRLPHWDAALALAKEASACYPGARWQHWDIGITDKGPAILELNSAGDLYAQQYMTGTGALTPQLRTFLAQYTWRDDIAGGRTVFAEPAPAGRPDQPGTEAARR